jgi:hypothetical protein
MTQSRALGDGNFDCFSMDLASEAKLEDKKLKVKFNHPAMTTTDRIKYVCSKWEKGRGKRSLCRMK